MNSSSKIVSYRLVVSYWEPVAPEAVQDLMIQQFLLDWIVQVHVLVEEQVFLEQKYVTMLSNGLGSVGRSRVGVSVPFPFRHDVGQLFFGH